MARVARRYVPLLCAYLREDFFPPPTVRTASQSDRRLPSSGPPKFDQTSGGGGAAIWGLSKCSAGEYIGFALQGNVTSLWVNYSVHDNTGVNPSGGRLSIMPPLGRNGVDLYAQVSVNGAWVWGGNAKSSIFEAA